MPFVIAERTRNCAGVDTMSVLMIKLVVGLVPTLTQQDIVINFY